MKLQALSDALAATLDAVAPSLLSLQDADATLGSAVAWSADRAVTAAHLVEEGHAGLVLVDHAGTRHAATVVGRDPTTDLALLAVEGGAFAPLPWRAPDTFKVGELALPAGRGTSGPRVRLGVLAAVDGPWRTRAGAEVDAWLEVDAQLPPALVGGVTLDAEGQVFGLNTPRLTRVGAVLPHPTVARVVERLEARGSVTPGWLGVRFSRGRLPDAVAAQVGQDQVLLVGGMMPGGPASRAGWKSDDAILAIDGTAVTDLRQLLGLLAEAGAGTTVTATLLRGGEVVDVATELGERRGPPWGGRGRGGHGGRGGPWWRHHAEAWKARRAGCGTHGHGGRHGHGGPHTDR
ncbi:MAG: serine protease [Alphaproteobacteria bacterium]|nr:serine protease [Alphaproteobacteria bacterium]